MVCEAFDAEGRSKLVMGRTSLQRYPLPLRKLLPVCLAQIFEEAGLPAGSVKHRGLIKQVSVFAARPQSAPDAK